MKKQVKRLLAGITCVAMIGSFAACKPEEKKDKKEKAVIKWNADTDPTEKSENIFSVDKVVHDGEYITLTCKEILNEGIAFEAVNKSDKQLSIVVDAGLDGIGMSPTGESTTWELSANAKKTCIINSKIKDVEHEILSMAGIIFVGETGVETFDVCDFELGGEKHAESLPVGDVQFTNGNVTVEYLGADEDGLNFKVVNNRMKSVTVSVDGFSLNGAVQEYAMPSATIVPHTEGIYQLPIRVYNESYVSGSVQLFSGTMKVMPSEEEVAETFPIMLGQQTEVTPPPKQAEQQPAQ